ncbi:uncharacterized protein [Lepeophtheirus salmonis]|uniref:uncharacterized protein isoform X4 n=2 Tax=Lepeophtheirus salmonis TaxID=72036 RepID=UPI003AF382C0
MKSNKNSSKSNSIVKKMEPEEQKRNTETLDTFSGCLELPPLRSPRGSMHSLFGSGSSRRDSCCSQESNASTISWSNIQSLRLLAARAGRSSSPEDINSAKIGYYMVVESGGDEMTEAAKAVIDSKPSSPYYYSSAALADSILSKSPDCCCTGVDLSPLMDRSSSTSSTGGLVRSRDGSHLSPNSQPFISLPSPNIQSAKNTVSIVDGLITVEDPKTKDTAPDSSQMIRRGALVPPKMDGGGSGGSCGSGGTGGCGSDKSSYSACKTPCRSSIPKQRDSINRASSSDENEKKVNQSCAISHDNLMKECSQSCNVGSSNTYNVNSLNETSYRHHDEHTKDENSNTNINSEKMDIFKRIENEEASKNNLSNIKGRNYPRRSSVVVIPPMQVCPGDLLVYSKALTRLGNEIDGSSTSNFTSENDNFPNAQSSAQRRSKNTWSLLKIFDREKKVQSSKTAVPMDLETILINMTPSEFHDEHLMRVMGLSWSDFLELLKTDRRRSVSIWKNSDSSTNESSESEEEDSPGLLISCTPVSVSTTMMGTTTTTSSSSIGIIHPNGSPLPEKKKFPSQMRRPSSSSLAEEEEDPELGGSSSPILLNYTPPRKCSDISRAEIKRRDAIWDLFQSENNFLIDHLMVLKNVYMEPLKKAQVEGSLMFAEPEILFGNLDELTCVNYSFCKDFLGLFLKLVQEDGSLPVIDLMVDLFGQKGQRARTISQAYHRYALNYINALNYLESLRRNTEFLEFEKWCNRDIRCKKLQLTDLLIAPVHHIMRTPLVFRSILSKTSDLEEKKVISKILEVKDGSLRELDDKMRWLTNFDRLLEIQRNIVWPSFVEMESKQYIPEFLKSALSRQPCERLIVSPRRQIIMEGSLILLDSGKPTEMFVILFDDLLVITRKKKSLAKKKSTLTENWGSSSAKNSDASMKYIVHKQPLSLDRFFIHEVSETEGASAKLENAFILICLNRFQQITVVHTFQAESFDLKKTWIEKLKKAQDTWKKTLDSTLFKGTSSSTAPQNNHSPTDDDENPYTNSL